MLLVTIAENKSYESSRCKNRWLQRAKITAILTKNNTYNSIKSHLADRIDKEHDFLP